MAKGNDASVTKEEKRAASAPAGSGDKYPGIEGATRGEVDAFLEALDEFQPVVRACDGFGFDERVRLGFARRRAFRSPRSLRDRLTGEPERRFQTS
jgi:hypothetical protein